MRLSWYNYIDKKKGVDLDVISCKEAERLVNSNKYISGLAPDNVLKKLIIKGLNEGVYIRHYVCDNANGGIGVLRGKSYLDETMSFLKELVYCLIPNLLIDTLEDSYKDVYAYTKMLRDILVDVVVEYGYLQAFVDSDILTQEDAFAFGSEIYERFGTKQIGIEEAILSYIITVMANKEIYTEYTYRLEKYFKQFSYLQKYQDRYTSWAKSVQKDSLNCGCAYGNLSGFSNILDLDLNDKISAIFVYLVITLYYAVHQKGECLTDISEREKYAVRQISLFNRLYDYFKEDNIKIDLSDCLTSVGVNFVVEHSLLVCY